MLLRIIIVGIVWSVLFIEGIRVILMTNWHFDIFRLTHWRHAWNLWRSGWVIDEPKEWAFILIVCTAIPAWATVWGALSLINWESFLLRIKNFVVNCVQKYLLQPLRQFFKAPTLAKTPQKQSMPKPRRNPHYSLEESTPNLSPERRAQLTGVAYKPKASDIKPKAAVQTEPKEFSHTLFEIDDNEPFDFDLFDENPPVETKPGLSRPVEEKQPPKRNDKNEAPRKKKYDSPQGETKNRNHSSNSTFEILKQKGYEVISGVTIKDIYVDFVGIAPNVICLCLNDKETGDWLADEERFNDEEPLWFSESSHRISPVRKIAIAQDALNNILAEADMKFKVIPYVIEQIGNIINAEDMFDIWHDLHINVTRIDRGTPKEIPLFAKKLDDADGSVDKKLFDKLKKMLRNDN